MSNIEIKTVELTIAPKNEKSRAFLDTCVFEPENIEEQNLGSLYITGEITKISSNSEYLINLLVSTIRKEYYLNTNRSPIESLEQSLSKTNEVLADFAEQGNIEWIGNLHMVIAVLKNNTLYFSQTGLAQTFLLRDQNIINIGQDLALDPKPHPLKTFSNIASGEIGENDKIILATSEFKNIATETKIKNIFGEGVDEYFKEKVESNLDKNINVAIIFLEAAKKAASSGISFVKIPTQPNLENLGIAPSQEPNMRETEKFSPKFPGDQDRVEEVINELNSQELEIPVSQRIRKAAKMVKFIVENLKKITIFICALAKKIIIRACLFLKPKINALINCLLEKSGNFAKKAAIKIKSISIFAAIIEKIKNIASAAKEKIDGITPQYIKNISYKNKIMIAAALVIAATAAFSVSIYNEKKKEENNMRVFSALLEIAKKAEKDAEIAEANEIYQGKDKTVELVRAALSASEKIIQSGYFTSEAQTIKESALKQMDKIEGITRINGISEIFNFAARSNNIRANGLVWLSKKLYSFNSENNAIYKYDLSKKTGEIMAVNSKDIGHLRISKILGGEIIFLTDLPGAASYDPSKSDIKKLSIKFAEKENEIADIAIYKQNSSLYTLNKNDNEIYKHSSIAAGFAGGEKWLKYPDGSPLANPVSLTIDGDIYVLQNNSANPIIKLTKGLKSEFSVPDLFTPLDKAVKIITETGAKNLYVLDPKNKRVVAIAKTGNAAKQFVSDKFGNLTDIAISPMEKEIYLLSGTSVYEIAL